jgi:TonB-linked SusC/RagA family outer membrane protein
MQIVNAQKREITGVVTNSEDGSTLPGVSVVVKGTTMGTSTDINGKYSIEVSEDVTALVFTFVGMKVTEAPLGESNVLNVQMEPEVIGVNEVVVTALGVSREKKSLGYATQEIKGDEVTVVNTDNVVNSLSGKISGVQVRRTNNMGGSSAILIRGATSLKGDNQALFVIDGVPVSNINTNTETQQQDGTGYDYGNAAADINPDDIESVNVLKGAAATALYGSRAANGVIMITTRKGNRNSKGVGLTINSGVTVGFIDKSTFPVYQKEYGGGYGPYYTSADGYIDEYDLDGDGTPDLVVPFTEDASYGEKFDPNLMVFQWDALDPELSTYKQKSPWVAADNGPITFFEKPMIFKNSISIDNGFESGSYRLSYTNYDEKGLMPNSHLERNTFLLSGNYDLSEKLHASGHANYVRTDGLGRNSTGYSDNILGSMRQWMQTNVDYQELKDVFDQTDRNITWNPATPSNFGTVIDQWTQGDLSPIYWDNPYWTRYKNYESDVRNRVFGNIALTFDINDWLILNGRVSVDAYSEMQEERRAVGSVPNNFGIGTGSEYSLGRNTAGSGYSRKDITFSEYNYDTWLNFDNDFGGSLNIKGILGMNIRRTNYTDMYSATNGGINIPEIYAIQNSSDLLPLPAERDEKVGVNGMYGNVSFGYNKMIYVDAGIRRDIASTLPIDNNTYYYPSIAASFLFSRLLESDVLSFGKIRLNYAEVGNLAAFDQILDTYDINMTIGGPSTSVNNTKKNANLLPERTKSMEAGLESIFLNNKFGFDLAFYKTNSVDQILPVRLSEATGYRFKVLNAGEIENKGIELTLNGTPVQTSDLTWNVNVNWAKNKNQVVSLTEGLDNLQLGSFQGGITINATVGQPYGVIYGTDYTYLNPDNPKESERLIDPVSGQYIPTSTSDNIIGDVNPDWNLGFRNSFNYKDFAFSFLIDWQKGGDIFSLDLYYGLATGLYEETAGNNDLGNPVRDPIVGTPGNYASNSGGFINDGVNPDGSTNETRINASRYGAWGYRRGLPNSAFVYSSGYVKLREISVSYKLPVSNAFIKNVSLSLVGSNLWIIWKDLPHADPESGLGTGSLNLAGYSTGSLPSTRNIALNVKLMF